MKSILLLLLIYVPFKGICQDDNSISTKQETIYYIENEIQKYASSKSNPGYLTQKVYFEENKLYVEIGYGSDGAIDYSIDLNSINYYSIDFSNVVLYGNVSIHKTVNTMAEDMITDDNNFKIITIYFDGLTQTMTDNLMRALLHLKRLNELETANTEDKFH